MSESNQAMGLSGKPYFVANEDNDHYFKKPSEFMTREALEAYIDAFALGHVTHFFMCPSGQRPSYATKAPNWEPIWAGMEEPNGEGQTHDIWAVNAKKLYDAGIDPYKVWIQRCHEKGVSPWFSTRMNDCHFAWMANYFRNTNFYKARVDLRLSDRREHPPKDAFSWGYFALDFAKAEVRDYTMGLVKEQISSYDIDGYEMDFMRFCHYFAVGHERENAHFMTDFVREVRDFANEVGRKRGRPIQVSVRVPYCPEAARDRGLFAVEWAKAGLVDWIVPTCGSLDYELPLDAWQRELGDTQVVLLPANDFQANSFPHAPFVQTTREMHYAWANAMYAAGAQGLYLFNIPYSEVDFPDFARTGLTPEFVARQTCRYRVGFRGDISEDGLLEWKEVSQLPRHLGYGDVHLTQLVGPHPEATRVTLVAAFSEEKPLGEDLCAWLNGVQATGARAVPKEDVYLYGWASAVQAVRWEAPVSALKEGINMISLRDGVPRRLIWCEIAVESTPTR